MPTSMLRIGTRRSALAQAQTAEIVKRLDAAFPDCLIQTILITTSGDRLSPGAGSATSETRDQTTGGLKAMFTKELEEALLDERIDLAVHSLKDMPARLPAGLVLAAVPPREDARDAWISRQGVSWKALPAGSRVGTGAIRRQAQIKHHRPDLIVVPMRGNVDTRLEKLKESSVDGIILALAGLRRLGRERDTTEVLGRDIMLPAIGQGCLAIEVRASDAAIVPFAQALDHSASHVAALAERALLDGLGGSCQTPIAGFAELLGEILWLEALVAAPDGQRMIRERLSGPAGHPEALGRLMAETLLTAGARDLLG